MNKSLSFFVAKILLSVGNLLLFSLFVASCKTSGGSFPGITAAGSPGELLLVMQKDWLEGEMGEETKKVLRMDVPALPQTEAWMRVQTVAKDDFGQFLQNSRNILIVDYNKEIYTTTSVKYTYDPFARGQLVVTIQTPSRESYRQYLVEKGRTICELFLRNELFRMASDLVEGYSAVASDLCREIFNYRVNLPKDVLSSKKAKNFLWVSNNAMKKRYDFVFFKIPYDISKGGLPTARQLIALRDSVLGAQIPGSQPPAKMSTSDYAGEYRLVQMPSGKQLVELRGLWEMTPPDLMAGPFVAQAFWVEEEEMLYYTEGFVYYPNENKRDLIRKLQAALFSFRPSSEEIFDPEPIKSIRWTKPLEWNSDEPSFANTLR